MGVCVYTAIGQGREGSRYRVVKNGRTEQWSDQLVEVTIKQTSYNCLIVTAAGYLEDES